MSRFRFNRFRSYVLVFVILAGFASTASAAAFKPADNSPIQVGVGPSSVITAFIDGDSYPDVAVVNFKDNNVSVLLGTAAGTFSPAAGSPFAVGTEPYAVISGDFNSDANIDLAVANSGSDNITILFGDGTGSFSPAYDPIGVGKTPYALTSSDLDGDGIVDIAVANLKSGDISILIGNADGTFIDPLSFPAKSDPAAIVAADFNVDEFDDDGPIVKDELAVADSNGNAVTIMSLTKDPDTLIYTMTTVSKYSVGSTPLAMVTGDFNADGMPDLAVANGNSKNISILIGLGTNLLAEAVHYTVEEFPSSLTTADLNGDGKPDLAVTHLSRNELSVLYGNGDGKFQAPLTFPVGKDPIAVTAGDFNADSAADLLTANYKDNTLSLLINTPDEVINVTSPAGGEHLHGGMVHTITWDAFPGAVRYQVLYSSNNGLSFKKLAKVGNVTSYSWSVSIPTVNLNDNLIKIIGYDASKKVVAEGISKSSFAIEAVSIVFPNGGEVVTAGGGLLIGWDTFATKKTPTSVKISYYDGKSWQQIATLNPIPFPPFYNWILPGFSATRHYYLVKVELKAGSKVVASDISDGFFTIAVPLVP